MWRSSILDLAKKNSMIQIGAASQLCLLQAKTDCDLKRAKLSPLAMATAYLWSITLELGCIEMRWEPIQWRSLPFTKGLQYIPLNGGAVVSGTKCSPISVRNCGCINTLHCWKRIFYYFIFFEQLKSVWQTHLHDVGFIGVMPGSHPLSMLFLTGVHSLKLVIKHNFHWWDFANGAGGSVWIPVWAHWVCWYEISFVQDCTASQNEWVTFMLCLYIPLVPSSVQRVLSLCFQMQHICLKWSPQPFAWEEQWRLHSLYPVCTFCTYVDHIKMCICVSRWLSGLLIHPGAEFFPLDCGGSTRSIVAAWTWFIC